MNNNDLLDRILLVRSIRSKLSNMEDFSIEEKEMARKVLNERNHELEDTINRNMNIESRNDVTIPLDEDVLRYQEFINLDALGLNERISIIESIFNKFDSINLSKDEKEEFLYSLKDYCRYLELMIKQRENNQVLYDEMGFKK